MSRRARRPLTHPLHAALRLITCGGHFDGETGHHVDNVVVYAKLVDERPAG